MYLIKSKILSPDKISINENIKKDFKFIEKLIRWDFTKIE